MTRLDSQSANLNKRKKLFLFLICFGVLILPELSFGMAAKRRPEGKGLYIYSGWELSRFFKDIGYPDFWGGGGRITISRNSDGTELRFFKRFKGKVIAVSCTGSVKELEVPDDHIWLNDNHEMAIRRDSSNKIVYFKNGMTAKLSKIGDPYFRADPSATYFGKYPDCPKDIPLSESCRTDIYSIEAPDMSLARVRLCGIRKIFYQNDKVYLFGNDYREDDETNEPITAHIFKRGKNRLIETEKITIDPPRVSHAPFYVNDLSPWDDEVLLTDVWDMPHSSVWYLFNLKTRELRKIGDKPFTGGWGFYLQCDIIKNATEKYEQIHGRKGWFW